MYSTVSIRPSHIEDHSAGFSQASSSCSISPPFTLEPLPSVASPFFFFFFHCMQPSKPPPKDIKDFSRCWQASSHIISLLQTKLPFWEFSLTHPPSHPPPSPLPLAGTAPKGTCSFNRLWYPSFKGIRTSTDLFIKNFFSWCSLHFSAFGSPNKNQKNKKGTCNFKDPHLPYIPKNKKKHEPSC